MKLTDRVRLVDHRLFGLAVGRGHVDLVEVDKTAKGVELLSYRRLDCDTSAFMTRKGSDRDFAEELAAVLAKAKIGARRGVVLARGGNAFGRLLSFPQMPDQELAAAVQLALEERLPYKIDDPIVAFHLVDAEVNKKGERQVRLLGALVKREAAHDVCSGFDRRRASVRGFSVLPLAHWGLLDLRRGEGRWSGCLDIGEDYWAFTVCDGEKLAYHREFPGGEVPLHALVAEYLERAHRLEENSTGTDVEVQLAERNRVDQLSQEVRYTLQGIVREIHASLEDYQRLYGEEPKIDRLHLLGSVGTISQTVEYFAKSLGLTVVPVDPIADEMIRDARKDREASVPREVASLLACLVGPERWLDLRPKIFRIKQKLHLLQVAGRAAMVAMVACVWAWYGVRLTQTIWYGRALDQKARELGNYEVNMERHALMQQEESALEPRHQLYGKVVRPEPGWYAVLKGLAWSTPSAMVLRRLCATEAGEVVVEGTVFGREAERALADFSSRVRSIPCFLDVKLEGESLNSNDSYNERGIDFKVVCRTVPLPVREMASLLRGRPPMETGGRP
jgi:Tfp pilus assembly PilM family ATPase